MLPLFSALSAQDRISALQGADPLRQRIKQAPREAPLVVAQQFEALFIQKLLQSMRSAIARFDPLYSSTEAFYQTLLDQQRALHLASINTLGLAPLLAKAILDQEKRMPSDAIPVSTVMDRKPAAPVFQASPSMDHSAYFLSKIYPAVKTGAADLGIAPQLMLAQAALETGWGEKPLRDATGKDTYNLFGIKASKHWQGEKAPVTTTEYIDGVTQRRVEQFRAYPSYAAAVSDYARLLKDRFREALGKGADALGFGQALQKKGYATDPHYAHKLAKIADYIRKNITTLMP